MAKKKRGYQQSLGEGHGSQHSKKKQVDGQAVKLSTFDKLQFGMVQDKCAKSEDANVAQLLKTMTDTLLKTETTEKLRDNMTLLSEKCRAGSPAVTKDPNVGTMVVALHMNAQFSIVKKHTTTCLLSLDPVSALKIMEDHIIEYINSGEFEHSLNDVLAISNTMLTFEFKLMGYLDMANKIAKNQKKPDEEYNDPDT